MSVRELDNVGKAALLMALHGGNAGGGGSSSAVVGTAVVGSAKV